jgi:tRNA 2-thiouridine synthesizing protein A
MAPTTKVDRFIDAKGQMCPMPILTLAKAARELPAGAVLAIAATDAGAKADVPAWCDKTGNTLLGMTEEAGVLTFYVRKNP